MPGKPPPNSLRLRNSTAEFLTFAYQTGGDGVEVRVQEGTIWLSLKAWPNCSRRRRKNALMHLKNIYAGSELEEAATAKDFLEVQTEGKRQLQRQIKHYNLDAGRISTEIAKEHAEGEFEKYRVIQDRLFRSDFDAFVALENPVTIRCHQAGRS